MLRPLVLRGIRVQRRIFDKRLEEPDTNTGLCCRLAPSAVRAVARGQARTHSQHIQPQQGAPAATPPCPTGSAAIYALALLLVAAGTASPSMADAVRNAMEAIARKRAGHEPTT